ncbi:hypothetical protein AA14337_2892 [Acetobacter malorum DSM 14337]|uniref:Uncharacterized protein n=1 Tax=Acetobacter malorum DSM 14337 TaxID=1307910 RepID=A0ABQ0PYF0_9PROT|nr:hypothetical protein [Acetobacter malorum]KXV06803.1 hypothetical protein AD930_06810 [Acetobacter malorum]GBQ84703.1 hypothetical protein AA14337_2892 [Acetobacter malorum DSM 14337]
MPQLSQEETDMPDIDNYWSGMPPGAMSSLAGKHSLRDRVMGNLLTADYSPEKRGWTIAGGQLPEKTTGRLYEYVGPVSLTVTVSTLKDNAATQRVQASVRMFDFQTRADLSRSPHEAQTV